MRHALALVTVLSLPALLAAQSAPAAPRDLPLDAAARRRFVGLYTLTEANGRPPSAFRVYEAGGVLMGQIRTNTPTRLLYQGASTFRPADSPEFTVAFTIEGDRATQVLVAGPGVSMPGVRDTTVPPDSVTRSADASTSGALYDELARMDSLLFDASYVACDTARIDALLTDDVEFYHDITGLHRGAQVRADFARLSQQCPRGKGVHRELVPGTLRVYPIADFGGVQSGEHRFIERGSPTMTSARFVTVWQKQNGAWKASRIMSFDHRLVPVARDQPSAGR